MSDEWKVLVESRFGVRGKKGWTHPLAAWEVGGMGGRSTFCDVACFVLAEPGEVLFLHPGYVGLIVGVVFVFGPLHFAQVLLYWIWVGWLVGW